MTRGVVIHAYNNEQIDYALMSLCNALTIKFHMKVPVCLITNDGTSKWLRQSMGDDLVDKAFDYMVLQEPDYDVSTKRFCDTLSTTHNLPWYNKSRSDSYDLTPFDETLIVDSDYLIVDDSLNKAWGSYNDVMINRRVIPLTHGTLPSSEMWLDHTGIQLCWATCIYFKKSQQAEMLFDIVKHIKTNYDYYAMIYGFPTQLYRNDYAFSIAVHMMSGFTRCDDIPSLPSDFLLTSFDCDELIDIPNRSELLFLVNDRTEQWRFTVSKIKNISVHVMNKFSLIRHADKIITLYGDA